MTVLSILPVFALYFVVNQQVESAFLLQNEERASAIVDQKKKILSDFEKSIKQELSFWAQSEIAKNSISELTEQYKALNSSISEARQRTIREDLLKVYETEFFKTYAKLNSQENSESLNLGQWVSGLDAASQFLQSRKYREERDGLSFSEPSEYEIALQLYQSTFKNLAKKNRYKNLFLISVEDSKIIYSSNEGVLIGRKLNEFPLQNTAAYQLFLDAKNLEKGESILSSIESFVADFNYSNLFAASPIFDEDEELVGVMIAQIGLEELAELIYVPAKEGVAPENDMIVDEKGFFITDPMFIRGVEEQAIRASIEQGLVQKSPEEALKKKTLVEFGVYPHFEFMKSAKNFLKVTEDLNHRPITAVMSDFHFGPNHWYVVSEISNEAMVANLKDLGIDFLLGSLLIVIVAVSYSFVFTNRISQSLSSVFASLKSSSVDLEGGSQNLAAQTQQLAGATNEQAAATHETISTMSELSSMIEMTKNNTKHALENSQEIGRLSDEGQGSIHRMSMKMDDISQANQRLAEVKVVFQSVTEKTKVINDIVFKTQLLSFNASIEAARAGQHGRGFSVVAEEIGALADLSGKAAREINAILLESEETLVEIVEEHDGIVTEGKQVSVEVEDLFGRLSSNIGEVIEQIESIDSASIQQADGIVQVKQAMKELEAGTSETENSTSSVNSIANQMKGLALDLVSVSGKLEKLIEGENHSMKSSVDLNPRKEMDVDSNDFDADDFSFQERVS